MKFSDALLIVKEFFLEVLGFVIPGIICLLIPAILLKKFHNEEQFIYFERIYNSYLLLIVSYTLGYIIYGASEFKDRFFSSKWYKSSKIYNNYFLPFSRQTWKITSFSSYKTELEDQIKQSEEWSVTKKLLMDLFKQYDYTHSDNVNRARNLAISYLSESDVTKIYTFTFRADLCRHISTIFIIYFPISCFLLFSTGIRELTVFKYDGYIYAFLAVLILATFFLGLARRRFYGISQRIPFSMFIATIVNLPNNEE